MEPFLGQIQAFGFNFPPRGWAFCNGQLLPISQNTALFSLLGTTFGGDGETTFALPDLRGRYIRHVGTGPGLDTVSWGQRGGTNQTTLGTAQMPSHHHVHSPGANTGAANVDDPSLAYPAGGDFYAGGSNTTMGSTNTGNTGGGQPFNILNPFLGIYVSIALVGIYPSD